MNSSWATRQARIMLRSNDGRNIEDTGTLSHGVQIQKGRDADGHDTLEQDTQLQVYINIYI